MFFRQKKIPRDIKSQRRYVGIEPASEKMKICDFGQFYD